MEYFKVELRPSNKWFMSVNFSKFQKLDKSDSTIEMLSEVYQTAKKNGLDVYKDIYVQTDQMVDDKPVVIYVSQDYDRKGRIFTTFKWSF